MEHDGAGDAGGMQSSLLTLPPHILSDHILMLLPARDLAAVAMCSHELRALGSKDALWWRLYETDFEVMA